MNRDNMLEQFDVRLGQVQGAEHFRKFTNCQDGLFVHDDGDVAVLLVADGCGSTPHPEVGAWLGPRLFVETFLSAWKMANEKVQPDDLRIWRYVISGASQKLGAICQMTPGNWMNTLKEFFYFTLVGCVITEDQTVFFTIGDGVIAVNGKQLAIDDYEGNAPPYLAYSQFPHMTDQFGPEFGFEVRCMIPTSELDSFLLGSDGLDKLIAKAGNSWPNRLAQGTIPNLGELWENPALSPQTVLRKANNAGQERKFGLLDDDTSVIVGIRKEEE